MIAGKDAFKPGEAKNSWLTGTAAWNFYAISQYILGIQPTYDGLRIDPCIPAEWKEYSVQRNFRGVNYNICIKNPRAKMKGITALIVDGNKIDGNVIPILSKDITHQVDVIL